MRNPYKVAFWVLFAAFGTVCFPLGCAVACLQLTESSGETGRFPSSDGGCG